VKYKHAIKIENEICMTNLIKFIYSNKPNMAGTVIWSVVGSAAVGQIMKDVNDNSSGPWYDPRNYYKFPSEYTELIDAFLMAQLNSNRVQIGSQIQTNAARRLPGSGKHWFYDTDKGFFGHRYITFDKVYNSDTKQYHYMCYVFGCFADTFKEAIRIIFKENNDIVYVITLDKSQAPSCIFPLFSSKMYNGPRAHQTTASNIILDYYNGHRKHCNVIICGYKGTGKSYTPRVLKKLMDVRHPENMTRLYDDFDPMTAGMSYPIYVKSNISQYIPAIVVIDEIDSCFKYALENKDDRDGNFRHARDRRSMLEFMDAMGDTQYSINVMTTEKSPTELYRNSEWHSFLRPGRVDMFIEYLKGRDNVACRVVNHYDIPGYNDGVVEVE
jgi:hypothetical protein